MSETETKLTGGCRCSRVRYEALSKDPKSVVCGCRDCQRASGSVLSVAIGIKTENFTITAGEGALKSYADTGDSGQPVLRFFCVECGSPLFAKPESYPVIVSLRAITLDTAFEKQPVFAVYTQNIPSWITLPTEVIEEGNKYGG